MTITFSMHFEGKSEALGQKGKLSFLWKCPLITLCRKVDKKKRAESIAFDSFPKIVRFIIYFVTTNFLTAFTPSIVAFTKYTPVGRFDTSTLDSFDFATTSPIALLIAISSISPSL